MKPARKRLTYTSKPKPITPVLLAPFFVRHADGFTVVQMPIVTVSEANRRGHWSKHAGRTKTQRSLASKCMATAVRPALPCTFELTRLAPRKLDCGDNLAMSMKAVRDGIADWLGVDDKDPRVTWKYEQQKDLPRTYGVLVTCFSDDTCERAHA